MIGRTKEIEELNSVYLSSKPEFVAIYGRRRVGKTYLVDETFKDKFTFRHAGLPPVNKKESYKQKMNRQLEAFYYSLIKFGLIGYNNVPSTWLEAFYLLNVLIEKHKEDKRIVIFIDELPWMSTSRSYFIEAFSNFWNNFCCYKHNILLIICGSSSSWILDNVIHSKSGLYGRVTHQIHLLPFTLKECDEFLKSKGINYSKYEVCEAYMAVGGIPYYLDYFKPCFSVPQNIDSLFFNEDASIIDEFDDLFISQFENYPTYRKIVEILGTKNIGYRPSDIAEELKIEAGGSFYTMIRALERGEFIKEYIPFGSSKREVYYKLVDPFCLFYLKQIKGHSGKNNYWQKESISQKASIWRGYAFENLCFNHIKQVKEKLGITGVSTEESIWYKKDGENNHNPQIDLIINRKDGVVNICEIKFYSDYFQMTKDYHFKIMRKDDAIREMISKKSSIQNVLITTFGLKNGEYCSDFPTVIIVDDLFN